MKIATKYLPVDVWTNLALKRAIRLLDGLGVGDVPGAPSVESVRAELRDVLFRRRAEHVGAGRRAAMAWSEAIAKTARDERRKAHAKTPHRRRT